MPRIRTTLGTLLIFLSLAQVGNAQEVLIECNTRLCQPATSDPDTAGLLPTRRLPRNARGNSLEAAELNHIILGSESYDYPIPILSLPGRGLDLNLTLYYNSRVWTVNSDRTQITFNADRDFPSYGFRLGFGYIEGPFTADTDAMLVEPDGTKRGLRVSDGTIYVTYDSSDIDFDSNPSVLLLRRKDSTQWKYEASSTTNIYRPIQIKAANGNYITIIYTPDPDDHELAIWKIIDTLGREIVFTYEQKKLVSITGPAFGGSSTPKTFATFTWTNLTFRHTFSAATVNAPPNNEGRDFLTGCSYANGVTYTFTYVGPPGEAHWGTIQKIERKSARPQVLSAATSATTTLTSVPRSAMFRSLPLRSSFPMAPRSRPGSIASPKTWTATLRPARSPTRTALSPRRTFSLRVGTRVLSLPLPSARVAPFSAP